MPKSKPERVSKIDRIMLRLPDGMRGRIAEAARKTHRSMNAYILSVMDEADPPLRSMMRPLDSRLLEAFRSLSTSRQQALLELLRPEDKVESES